MRTLFCSVLITAVYDGLVYPYRRCAARFAPQELAGADALAKALSDQPGSVAESEQARQCEVLRPMFDALWPEFCE